ncbi:MAG: winged helix family transcriptional regulator [Bdellovibrio sp.]|nr:MAG: winged helix family transcriptional regulator [Bdellovibrio sp.]
MKQPRVLIFAPTPDFLKSVSHQLMQKFEVQWASSEPMTLFLFQKWTPLITVLPSHKTSLLKALQKWKSNSSFLIAVNSKKESPLYNEKIALEQGANLFLHLPEAKSQQRLVWYIEAIQKQHTPSSFFLLKVPEQSVSFENKTYHLSKTQIDLLNFFIQNPEKLLTRKQIQEQIWPQTNISLRSIDAHISKLKKALPPLENYIQNIYGKGYIFSLKKKAVA